MIAVYTEADIKRMKADIDSMSQRDMASLWRFAPVGHPYFRSDLPLCDHFNKRFSGFTPEISKQIGWEK